MIMYHGTLLRDAKAIKASRVLPKINIKNELDFGYGFYLGDYRYAVKVSKDKTRREQISGNHEDDITPAVMEYMVDFETISLSFADGLVYKTKTKKYLDTVFNCRYHKGDEYLNCSFVFAPLADGFVNTAMDWYKDKPSGLRKVVSYLRYWIPTIYHRQFVVKSDEVCKHLKLMRILNEKGDVLWEENSEVTA